MLAEIRMVTSLAELAACQAVSQGWALDHTFVARMACAGEAASRNGGQKPTYALQ